jgi:hypothetical protein
MECGAQLRTPGFDLDYWLWRWENSRVDTPGRRFGIVEGGAPRRLRAVSSRRCAPCASMAADEAQTPTVRPRLPERSALMSG